MKYWFLILMVIVLSGVSAQTVDSIAIRQVDSLIQISRTLTGQKEYDKALEVNAVAKTIALEKIGKVTPLYGKCCHLRGYILHVRGDLSSAEEWYLEGKAIREKTVGKEHPDYAGSLNNLGILYYYMGEYEKAEPYYLEAKSIYEKTNGKLHPDYAGSLNNLANLYYIMGSYEKVEPLYQEAKAIREKMLSKDAPDYVGSLINLGNLYNDMGDFDRAEPLFLEAKEIIDKTEGIEHVFYVNCMLNLSNLYKARGEFEKAEPLLVEAIEFMKSSEDGSEQRGFAGALINLANLYWAIGAYDKAGPLFLIAKDKIEKTLGKDHLQYASCLTGMANIFLDQEEFNQAEQLFLEAKNITEKAMGNKSLHYADCLNNLSVLYETIGKYGESEQLRKTYFELTQSQLIHSTSFMSERELGNYVATFKAEANGLASKLYYRIQKKSSTGLLPALAYDQALFQKGFLLTSINRLKLLAKSSSEGVILYQKLRSLRRRLVEELSLPQEEQSEIVLLEEEASTTEKDLVRLVSGYAESSRQVSWLEVQSTLKPNEAALEFIHFQVNFPKNADSIMYAALLLRPDFDQPRFIPLFEEKALALLVSSNTERKADYVNELYTLADRGLVKLGTEKSSLYDLIWKPLEAELSEVKTIYYSPSGLLHRINIDAIPVSEMETIADKYQLITLNSTRQLVIPTQIKNANNDAILFGGIQFEPDSTIHNNEPLLASRSRGELSFTSVDSTLRGGTWNYLAGTEREVNAIDKIMQNSGINPSLKKGYEATEETFKHIGINNAPSPRILHIATHGYFFLIQKAQLRILN
jgi:tetratricopeptide (TPR) repeat protein